MRIGGSRLTMTPIVGFGSGQEGLHEPVELWTSSYSEANMDPARFPD
jgi:hypothetical protein